jgi:hypothetical protein
MHINTYLKEATTEELSEEVSKQVSEEVSEESLEEKIIRFRLWRWISPSKW